LADSDQLGLFVVARLAVRHGIKVALHRSAYGGVAAVVLLPPRLIVHDDDPAVLAGVAGTPPALGDPVPAISRQPWQAADGMDGPWPDSTGAHPGLPRRQPQASLADRLRDGGPAREAAPVGGSPEVRSPERARALIASFQQGWRTGQADDSRDSDRRD